MTAQCLAIDQARRISEMAFLACRATTQPTMRTTASSLRVTHAAGDEALSMSHIARFRYATPNCLAGLLELLACWRTHGSS